MCEKKIQSGVTELNEDEIYVLFSNMLFFLNEAN